MTFFSRGILLVFVCVVSVFSLERVPKQYGLEFGGLYGHRNDVSGVESFGVTIMFDYSWQLSGLDGTRAASYISVPIGYTYFQDEPTLKILSYGWTIRHDLLKDKTVVPFLGYGLLLNQLSDQRDAGKRFGHQTRFDLGCEWFLDKPLHLFTKTEWSMTRFPDREGGSDWMYRVALKVGVRYCKTSRD